MMNCTHKNTKFIWFCGTKTIGFRCQNCQVVLERNTTKEEAKTLKNHITNTGKEVKQLHKIYHEFQRKFIKNDKFKLKGYDLMEAVDKWVRKHPSVQISRCDDSYFASSDLVLIPHENEFKYMGTSVIFIPQCTGEEPIQFFLYPAHTKYLTQALKNVNKLEKQKRKKSPKLTFRY